MRCVTSLTRGYAPTAGVQEQPYEWSDLLDGPVPARRGEGDGTYVVYHGAEGGADARIAFATLVAVRQGDVEVNDRVAVRRPLLFEALDWERRWSRRFEARVQARMRQRHVAQSVRARYLPVWLRFHYLRFARWQTRMGLAAARLVVALLAYLVAIPDIAFSKVEAGVNFLGSRVGRREFLRGFREPASLSPLGKSIVLATSAVGLTLGLATLNSIFSLFPGTALAAGWAAVYSLIAWGVLTALVLPTPYELNLLAAKGILGIPMVIAVGLLAKVIGGWMVFFLGDMLNAYIDRQTRGRKWASKVVRGLEAFGRRYGPVAMVALLSVPFYPETFTLYLFGSLNMPMRRYLAAVVVGMAIRFMLFFTGFGVLRGLLQQG